MKRPLGAANGALEPESLIKAPPAATTMALPVAVLVTPAPLPSVILPVVSARKVWPPIACTPSRVMPPLPP